MATLESANPFPPLFLTENDARQLEGLADAFIRNAMDQYERTTFDGKQQQQEIDERRWKFVLERNNINVFTERREKVGANGASSALYTDIDDAPVTNHDDLPVVLLTGTIECTLDDALYAYICPDIDTMRVKTAYIDDQIARAAVLATLIKPTPADPFRSLSIKWFEKARPLHVRAIAKNRDFVYMESTGTDVLSNGERIGYHLIHSVQFPQTPELDTLVRGNMSLIGIFRQKPDNTVNAYVTGVMNPAGGIMRSIIVKSAAHGIISVSKYQHCAELKKLAWFMRQKTSASASVDGGAPKGHGTTCVTCSKKASSFSLVGGSSRATCKICSQYVCSSCRLKKKLNFIAKDRRLVQQEMTFCASCVRDAVSVSALQIAQEEVVATEPFSWNTKYANSSSSSEVSPKNTSLSYIP